MKARTLVGVICGFFSVQSITAQCLGQRGPGPLAYAPELSSAGGSFAVRSTSPIAPTGVTVLSDQLVIEGPLVIDGKLPFLGTVALEGNVPSVGAGNVAHACGGGIGISSEINPVSAGVIGGPSLGPAPLGPGRVGAFPLGAIGSGISGGFPLGRGFGVGNGRLY